MRRCSSRCHLSQMTFALAVVAAAVCSMDAFVPSASTYRSSVQAGHPYHPLFQTAKTGETNHQQVDLTDRIRLGLQASQNAPRNITAAEEACDIWQGIFEEDTAAISSDVIKLSKSLYASCLVRTGQDSSAISIYEQLLQSSTTTNDQVTEWRLAKARCHQRLMDYATALEEYKSVQSLLASSKVLDQALTGAVTCAMRLGDAVQANELLSEYVDSNEGSSEVRALATTIHYLRHWDTIQAVKSMSRLLSTSQKDVQPGSPSPSFLYSWILGTLTTKVSDSLIADDSTAYPPDISREQRFMELIKINTCPFDDPYLRFLDDKIKLHKVLTHITSESRSTSSSSSSSSSWPQGFIMPHEASALKQQHRDESSKRSFWISKSRSGYGSHGNQIMTLPEVFEKWDGTKHSTKDETVLLQRMMNPLMLLDGYKFSLRVYIVYFAPSEIYISSKGLVKLASEPFDPTSSTINPRIHMTNSGREASMQQYDLEYLWRALSNSAAKRVWYDIGKATSTVLSEAFPRYIDASRSENRIEVRQSDLVDARGQKFGIPKILGLDFVVEDANDSGVYTPWLVEVNRFPGLEPRDELDRNVKYQIVRDAWKKAADRANSERCRRIVDDFVEPILDDRVESSLHILQSSVKAGS